MICDAVCRIYRWIRRRRCRHRVVSWDLCVTPELPGQRHVAVDQ